ncbi:restriction endonuclease subunit S [Planococcus plakortidis]|uniref:restriction endonuclease subunit S n=1 Tax=Planococcus plakortidis TaxID=1038856 RepID=UPI0038591E6C
MNVPQLRFKGFEGEWKETKVGEILILLKSGLSRKLSSYNIGIPVIRSTNLVNGNLDLSDLAYWYRVDDQGAKIDNYILERGDILINFINSQAQIGKSCIYTSDIEAIYTTNIFRIKTSKEKSINEYFYYWTLTERYRKEIQNIVKPAVNQASFTTKEFNEIKYYLPSLKEQEKVADFFTLIDKKIEKQQEKIEKLEQFKKGMMQKIFSQELRFKDEDGGEFPEWEYKKLGQIADIIMGQSPKGENYSTDIQQTVLIQGNADMKNGKVIPRIYTSEITKACLPGDIIMSVRAPVGEIALTDIEACIGRGVCAIRGSGYVYHYLYYFNLIKAWNSLSQGSTFESVNGNDIKTLTIPVPSSKEQEKIAYYLTRLERKVEKEKKKLMFLSKQKKGFMQKLFI